MRYYVAQIDYMNREGRWQSEQIDQPYAAPEGNREAAHRALHNAPEIVRKNALVVTVKLARSALGEGASFAVEELTGERRMARIRPMLTPLAAAGFAIDPRSVRRP